MAIPELPDGCWGDIDTSCGNLLDYEPAVQARAIALAVQALRILTAYQVGGCPVTVRPCSAPCVHYGDWMHPVLYGGVWLNRSCGCPRSCQPSYQIALDTPVGRIDEVTVGTQTLPPESYRVDDGKWLVRLDGQPWPLSQDMNLPVGAEGTFSVTYLRAWPVDGLGAHAAGLLAAEFAKACNGSKCKLPEGVTQIVRQGIVMTLTPGTFPGGMTGIREVDSWVQRYNPHHLTQKPAVWTPGGSPNRVTTWSAP